MPREAPQKDGPDSGKPILTSCERGQTVPGVKHILPLALSLSRSLALSLSRSLALSLSLMASRAEAQHVQTFNPAIGSIEDQCPTWIGGDREFDGHGPVVTFSSDVQTHTNQRQGVVTTQFHAIETVSDFSEAQQSHIQLTQRVNQCNLLTQILSDPSSSYNYTDDDHEVDYKETFPPGQEMAAEMKVRGDTSGKDLRNCTNDDTKWWIDFEPMEFRETTDAPECRKSDGTPPDVTEVDGDPVLNLLNSIASDLTLHLDNMEFAFGGGDHVFVQNASYLELALPGAPAIRLPFTLPTVEDGRYTYFVDDVTSNGITVEPNGGGYLIKFEFEENGTEIRSNCEARALLKSGEWISLQEFYDLYEDQNPGETPFSPLPDPVDPVFPYYSEDFIQFIEKETDEFYGGDFVQCELGNEVQVDLSKIQASVRLWFWVDENTGLVRFRQPSASNRSEDVFVHVKASSQSGPCHDNVLAIHHDCMELDELDLMIEAQLRGALGEMMFMALDPQQQQSNLFAEIIGDIVDLLGPFSPNLQAIFVGDTGESRGNIFFVTN